jgi:hypothetical protein
MGTRDRGMATGPITFAEIEAYQRQMLVSLTPWDVMLIRRLDDATQAVKLGITPAPSDARPTDVGGLKSMLRGVAARKALTQPEP